MKIKVVNVAVLLSLLICAVGTFGFPISVQAATEITGGKTKDTAIEIELNKDYEALVPLTEDEFGEYTGKTWYKFKLPEYTQYIVLGVVDDEDEFAYRYNDFNVYDEWGESLNQVYYESYKSAVQNLNGQYSTRFYYVTDEDNYIYLEAYAGTTDTIPFYVAAGVNPQKDDNVELQLNQTYTENFYASGIWFVDEGEVSCSNYCFTAPYTGKYRINCKSNNGDTKGEICDYTGRLIKSFRCETNDEVNVLVSLKEGMNYQLSVAGGTISSKKPTVASIYLSNKPVTSVTVPETKITLNKAERYQIKPVVLPVDAVDTSVTYETSNKKVAKVSNKGCITAVGPGTAVISVESNDGSGNYAEIKVTVKPVKVTRIKLSTTTIVLSNKTGKEAQIKAKVYPDSADNKAVTYKSSNPKIVAVDKKTGKLKPKKAGTVTITCTSKDGTKIKAKCKVIVKKSYFK